MSALSDRVFPRGRLALPILCYEDWMPPLVLTLYNLAILIASMHLMNTTKALAIPQIHSV
jgi:hypothetical protein